MGLILLFLIYNFVEIIYSTHPDKPRVIKQENLYSTKGTIYSQDGLTLARSVKMYYLAINGNNIYPSMYKITAKLLEIYTEIDQKEILKVLKEKKRSVLLKELDEKSAKKLKKLSRALYKMGAFKRVKNNVVDLEIEENLIQKREYPFGELFSPILGYVKKDTGIAQMGLEKFYEDTLSTKRDGLIKAAKDNGGNFIYNKDSEHQTSLSGSSIQITVNLILQKKIEELLSIKKDELDADELIAGIMESSTGKIVALATSNRYNPESIELVDNTKMGVVQYMFEPGSVIKPLILASLFELDKVKQYEPISGFNGKWVLDGKKITDDVKQFDWISAENVIIYSSNIGISQLALRLSGVEIREWLSNFGITKDIEIDLPYRQNGKLPSIGQYDNGPIYKATSSYGYGFQVNFMQLLNAYNIINNDGNSVRPMLVSTVLTPENIVLHTPIETQKVISMATAIKMKNILRKTVIKGTGVKANIEGIYVAGKTGTAHIAENGKYVNSYNSSFFGFANDENSRYTIGVVSIRPKRDHFSSQNSVPIAKEIIELMIAQDLLKKEEIR